MKEWFKKEEGDGQQKSIGDLKKYMTRDNMIILVLMGVLLFIIAIPSTSSETEETVETTLLAASEESALQTEVEVDDYCTYLENKLEILLSCMDGVGNVKVMVTIAASEQIIIEKDESTVRSNTSENDSDGGSRTISDIEMDEVTVYIAGDNGTTEPVIIQTIEPIIEGVVVIAEGGGSEIVEKNISEAIQSLFDISVNKIKVVKMK